MKEKFQEEIGPIPETEEDLKYKTFQESIDIEEYIMEKIDYVLKTMPREEAEKIVLKNYVPMMDEAMRRSKKAFQEWLDSMDKSYQQENKEIDDLASELQKKKHDAKELHRDII